MMSAARQYGRNLHMLMTAGLMKTVGWRQVEQLARTRSSSCTRSAAPPTMVACPRRRSTTTRVTNAPEEMHTLLSKVPCASVHRPPEAVWQDAPSYIRYIAL